MSRITPAAAPVFRGPAAAVRSGRTTGHEAAPIYRIVARNESLFLDLVDSGLLGVTGLFDRGVLPTRAGTP